jgi:hypothetical protein
VELSDEAVEFLAEIRDLQREHLEEYRRISARVLEIQEQAIRNQAEAIRRQKVAALILALMGGLLTFYLIAR